MVRVDQNKDNAVDLPHAPYLLARFKCSDSPNTCFEVGRIADRFQRGETCWSDTDDGYPLR